MVKLPRKPTPVPARIGKKTIPSEPKRSPTHLIKRTATAAVSIVLITSPIPANWKLVVVTPLTVVVTAVTQPEPRKAAPPTQAASV